VRLFSLCGRLACKISCDGYFSIREVFKARNRKTNHIVALKKVRMENEKEGVSTVFTNETVLPL